MYRNTQLPFALIVSLLFISLLQAEPLPRQVAGWTRTEIKVYTGQDLFEYINGGAEIYLEYGFFKVDAGYYSKDEMEIQVDVYSMSSPQASAGIYSFFRNGSAQNLPSPYTGKQYDFHLECVNGSEYIKIVYYDSLGQEEPLRILRDLRPKPVSYEQPDFSRLLPEERLPESEIIFNGPIALKNFCALGRKNFFGVGTRCQAFGCLVEEDEKIFKWVTLKGVVDNLHRDMKRFITYQGKQDYGVLETDGSYFLEDQLGGNSMMLVQRGDRLFTLFGVENMEAGAGILRKLLR